MNDWVTNMVESMGYLGVGLLMMLENVFPPIPSELVMPLAGYVCSKGQMNLWLAIAAGSVGTLIGTLPWYGLARWLDREKVRDWIDRHGHWLTVDNDELDRAERWFDRHGAWMVIVGRLVPGIRTLISVPAGFCRMPLLKYLLYSALGTVVWTGILAYLGKVLGERYETIGKYVGPVSYVVLGTMLLIYVVRLVRMRRRNHDRAS